MKQRIRGLVSLHEIPFPLMAYKGKKAIVHITPKEEERQKRGGGTKISPKYIVVFYVSLVLLGIAAVPPVTSHHLFYFLCLFGDEVKEAVRSGRKK